MSIEDKSPEPLKQVFYDEYGEIYVRRYDPEFAHRMLLRTAMLASVVEDVDSPDGYSVLVNTDSVDNP